MSKSYSAENPTNLLRLNAEIARNQPKLDSKVIIYQPTPSNKLISNPYNLIQVEQNTDETMDMQPLLEERKKLGFSTCEEGQEYDCALNTLLDMGVLEDNEAHYLWKAVNDTKFGLYREYVRQIFYYYYHKRYKGAYMPDIYMLIADVNTPEQLNTVLESLKQSLKKDHYTFIGGSYKTSGGHAFLVGKDQDDDLIFKDQQANTGWVSKEDPQYQNIMDLLSGYKNFVFFVERDVGLERLRARKPNPSPRKTSKKRKRGRILSLRLRKSKSLPSLKKRKHKHDYGIFPKTPGRFHPGVRRKTNKKRKNAKKKTQKRKRK